MVQLIECSDSGNENNIAEGNCDYTNCMELLVNGKDRTHLSDKPVLSEKNDLFG